MRDFKRLVEQTADGSNTLYIPELDEHYHSTNGAVVEANHVYLEAGLRHQMQQQAGALSVLEVGFGTGLNAFLSLLEAEKSQRSVVYTTLELYPLSLDLVSQMCYVDQVWSFEAYRAVDVLKAYWQQWYEAMHAAPWGEPIAITPYFTLVKKQLDLTKEEIEGAFDVVYYDAFGPDKQPEMWSDEVIARVCRCMNPLSVVTTYCAKGVVRRGIQQQGFVMERLPGPPGKREMLRGTKLIVPPNQ